MRKSTHPQEPGATSTHGCMHGCVQMWLYAGVATHVHAQAHTSSGCEILICMSVRDTYLHVGARYLFACRKSLWSCSIALKSDRNSGSALPSFRTTTPICEPRQSVNASIRASSCAHMRARACDLVVAQVHVIRGEHRLCTHIHLPHIHHDEACVSTGELRLSRHTSAEV